jgi:hypothetical protein
MICEYLALTIALANLDAAKAAKEREARLDEDIDCSQEELARVCLGRQNEGADAP